MAAGWLNPSAGPAGTMPEDAIGEHLARQKLAKLLAQKNYDDASPKQHPLQVLAQIGQGIDAGLDQRQELASALAMGKASSQGLMQAIGAGGGGAAVSPSLSGPSLPPRSSGAASSRGGSIPGSLALDENQLDIATRTAMAEAGGLGPSGMKDVAAVLRNRSILSGKSVADEALAKNQFEPWNPGSKNDPRRFKSDSPEYQAARAAIAPVLAGEEPDPTGGATHFYAPKAQAALGRRPPSWDDGSGEDRGGHRFFRHPWAGKDPRQLAQAPAAAEAPAAQAGLDPELVRKGSEIPLADGTTAPLSLEGEAAPKPVAAADGLRAQLQAAFDAKRAGEAGPDTAFTSFVTDPKDPEGGYGIPPEVRATAPAGDPSGMRPEAPAPAMAGMLEPDKALPPRMPPAMSAMPDPTNPQGVPEDLRGQLRQAMEQSQAKQDLASTFSPSPMGAAPGPIDRSVPAVAPATGAEIAEAPMPPSRPDPAALQQAALAAAEPAPSPAMPPAAPEGGPRPRQQLAQSVAAAPPEAMPAPTAPPQNREGLARLFGGVQDGLDRVFGGPETQARLDADQRTASAQGPYPTGPWGAASDGRGGLLNRLMDGPAGPGAPGAPASLQGSQVPKPTAYSALPGGGSPGGAPRGAPMPAPSPEAAPPAAMEAPAAPRGALAPEAAPGGAPGASARPQQVAQAGGAPSADGANSAAPTPRAAALLGYIAKMAPGISNPTVKANYELAQKLYDQEVAPKTSTVDRGDSVDVLDARGNTLRTIQKTKGADFGEIGRDAMDRPIYGYRNYSDQTVKRPTIEGVNPDARPVDARGREVPVGIDPKKLREIDTERYANAGAPADPKQVSEVRREVLSLPSYKNLSAAAPVYRSMVKTADTDSKASDLNLIYALGKIMDPGSVVRESELALAQGTSGLDERLVGLAKGIIGGAKLGPETRAAILKEAYGRVQSYEEQFGFDTEHYKGIATRGRMNVEDIIPNYPRADAYVSKADRDAQAADEQAEAATQTTGATPKVGPLQPGQSTSVNGVQIKRVR